MDRTLDYKKIGRRIRKKREELNYSQEWLAELTDVSVCHLSHLETGRGKMSLRLAVDLSEKLQCSLDWLLFDDDWKASSADRYRGLLEEAERMNEQELKTYTAMGRTIRENSPYRAEISYSDENKSGKRNKAGKTNL